MNKNKWFLNGGRESGRTFRLLCEIYENKIADLEKENAELKEQCSILADCNTCTSTCKTENIEMKKQLTKAKDLLAKWVELFKPKLEGYPITPIQEQTEQFLKDCDIDNAIQQANKGLDFDKIADEMEQDLKDSEVEK